MDIVRRPELEELASFENGPCMTVYLPLHRAYPEKQADPIQFRNLLDRAEKQLLERDLRGPDVRELLRPARELQADETFWRSNGAGGLAVFLARDFYQHRRLPYPCPDTVDVAEGFYVGPLAHSLTHDVQFHLLALSPNRVRLYRGDSQGMTAVDLPDGVPDSENALRAETEFQSSLQYHTSSGFGPGGSLKGTAHGHRDARDDRQIMFEEFLQTVSRGLEPLLKAENLPLFVAAVEQHHPVFRKISHYPLLQEEGVTGSPEELSEQEMFAQALPLAKTWSRRDLVEHRRRYDKQRGTDQASDDVETIVPAAHQGRVNALFAAQGERRWGAFDPASQRAAVRSAPGPGDLDLVDLAVKLSLTHGSNVFVVGADEVPDGRSLAATFRW